MPLYLLGHADEIAPIDLSGALISLVSVTSHKFPGRAGTAAHLRPTRPERQPLSQIRNTPSRRQMRHGTGRAGDESWRTGRPSRFQDVGTPPTAAGAVPCRGRDLLYYWPGAGAVDRVRTGPAHLRRALPAWRRLLPPPGRADPGHAYGEVWAEARPRSPTVAEFDSALTKRLMIFVTLRCRHASAPESSLRLLPSGRPQCGRAVPRVRQVPEGRGRGSERQDLSALERARLIDRRERRPHSPRGGRSNARDSKTVG